MMDSLLTSANLPVSEFYSAELIFSRLVDSYELIYISMSCIYLSFGISDSCYSIHLNQRSIAYKICLKPYSIIVTLMYLSLQLSYSPNIYKHNFFQFICSDFQNLNNCCFYFHLINYLPLIKFIVKNIYVLCPFHLPAQQCHYSQILSNL